MSYKYLACIPVLLAIVGAPGCIGYLMGWSDAEVERSRRIIAELEAKNAALVDEVLKLRAELRRAAQAGQDSQPRTEAKDAKTDSNKP